MVRGSIWRKWPALHLLESFLQDCKSAKALRCAYLKPTRGKVSLSNRRSTPCLSGLFKRSQWTASQLRWRLATYTSTPTQHSRIYLACSKQRMQEVSINVSVLLTSLLSASPFCGCALQVIFLSTEDAPYLELPTGWGEYFPSTQVQNAHQATKLNHHHRTPNHIIHQVGIPEGVSSMNHFAYLSTYPQGRPCMESDRQSLPVANSDSIKRRLTKSSIFN
jgi:hypothetical protein